MPSQFRALEQDSAANRKDMILRASVSAFVALTKPNKRDCNQIEDLAGPILPMVSDATKRFVCAALSESGFAPASLVRHLCSEDAEICAPLLLKSPVLSAVDLVAIIGRKGKPHARVIARRDHLPNDVIEALAMIDDVETKGRASAGASTALPLANVKPANAQEAREILAGLMLSVDAKPSETVAPVEDFAGQSLPRATIDRLIGLALKPEPDLFATALADLTGLPFQRLARILKRSMQGELLTVLKALDVETNAAFTLACVFFPATAASKAEISLFRERYIMMDGDKCLDIMRRWKSEEIALSFKRKATNTDAVSAAALKAS